MTDPTLTPETIIATAAANLRASVERPSATLRQRIREHQSSEPCPPQSQDDRSWPLALAPRVLLELSNRPGAAQFPVAVKLVEQLIDLRLALLLADLEELNKVIARQRDDQTTPETLRAEALRELRRSLIYAADLGNARAELQRSGDHLQGILTGATCPTCLRAPLDGCRSGWRAAPTDEKPRRFLECEQRAELNGREPVEFTP